MSGWAVWGEKAEKGKGGQSSGQCNVENVQLVGCAPQLVSPQLGEGQEPWDQLLALLGYAGFPLSAPH